MELQAFTGLPVIRSTKPFYPVHIISAVSFPLHYLIRLFPNFVHIKFEKNKKKKQKKKTGVEGVEPACVQSNLLYFAKLFFFLKKRSYCYGNYSYAVRNA